MLYKTIRAKSLPSHITQTQVYINVEKVDSDGSTLIQSPNVFSAFKAVYQHEVQAVMKME